MKDQLSQEENAALFRERFRQSMSGCLGERVREGTQELLRQVAWDAFLEGWLAAGGVPPYVVHTVAPDGTVPPKR